jgi:hypothetical protein
MVVYGPPSLLRSSTLIIHESVVIAPEVPLPTPTIFMLNPALICIVALIIQRQTSGSLVIVIHTVTKWI